MISILDELDLRTKENPDKLLYAFLDIKGNVKESYSYLQFQQRTDVIAAFIRNNYPLQSGDRVLLAYPPGIEMICAFFACVKLGLIPVPVYPPGAQGFQSALQKMNFIAEDCGAKAVLTERSYYWSVKVSLSRNEITSSGTTDLISKLEWIVSNDSVNDTPLIFPRSHSDILFLQYTSGSTNNPKGVIVTHENILHNCSITVDHLPIGVSWLPQYHDMGLIGYYIFFALKGGTTYGFSPLDFIQRPALWLETISKYSATASSAPNFAYEYCLAPGNIPDETLKNLDLSSLQFLMSAAEPVSPKVYHDFFRKFESCGLKPESYFAAYGLAEFTLAVSNYGRKSNSFATKRLKESVAELIVVESETQFTNLMGCGNPLGDTQIKIVDITSTPSEIDAGRIGEIWLSGTSKCVGYWNRPELTREIFEAKLNGDSTSWLRTGDLGFIHNDELYVCGRTKDMIIIRGLNYYPRDIEFMIEENDYVRKGCVAAFSVEENNRESLVVIIGLKNNKKIPDAHALNNKLVKYLGISADHFVFIPARTISKTSSGKIMRHQNKNRFLMNELPIIEQVDFAHQRSSVTEEEHHNTLGTAVQSDHRKLFHSYGLTGSEDISLGEAGLDSIRVAEFTHDLKEYIELQDYSELSNEVDIRIVQKIAVSELFEVLEDLHTSAHLSRFRFKQAFTRLQKEFSKAELEMMKKDSTISPRVGVDEMLSPYDNTSGHILLTGGTGFFGPFLIKSLLEQNEENIYVIVRADTPDEGKSRLRKAFADIESAQFLSEEFGKRVIPVCGDLSQPRLGLKDDDWIFLANKIHTIYHNGALVNYLFDYESMRDANVNGTREIIRLAQTSRSKFLNYISTTFIFGWSVKDTLYETDCNEKMEHLDFGYSQSKWVSEQVVLNAMANGLKARIFRPALISPSVSGEGFNFDISIRLMTFMVKYGIGTSAKNQVSFTPADLAANNIVAISNIEESIGRTFHVTRDEYSNMPDVTDILGELTGKRFRYFPLPEFVPEVVSRCNKDELLFPLLNFLVRSVKNISAMEFKRYDNSNYRKYRDLSPCGKKDDSLIDVVTGILLFMQKQGIILQEKPEQLHA